MTVLSIVLMGGTVLFPNDGIHQILGMALFILWICHTFLNRRWYGALFRGKYVPYRVMQTVVNLGIAVCSLLLMISGMMMAWFVPAEIVGNGLGFARTVHLVSSHWYYVLMAFHIGLHLNMMAGKMKIHGWLPRVIFLITGIYGLYAFIIRGVWKYMFLRQHFFFFDFERGYVLFVVDYLSILVLMAGLSYYLRKLILKIKVSA